MKSKITQNTDAMLIAGIQKHASNVSFVVQSQSQSAAQVVETLQGRVDAAQAVATTKAAWKGALQAATDQQTATAAYSSAVRNVVQTMYANSPQTLADFGLVPRKARAPLDAAATVVAAAKRNATRAARHTMGKKQKAAIVGTVTLPIVVPVNGAATSGGVTTPASGSPGPSPETPGAPAAPASASPAGTANGSSVANIATHS